MRKHLMLILVRLVHLELFTLLLLRNERNLHWRSNKYLPERAIRLLTSEPILDF